MSVSVRTSVERAAALVMGLACASARPVPGAAITREGVYVAGPEANTFRECHGSLQWTVEFAPGVQPVSWPVGSHGGYNGTYYFVRWEAELIVPPRVPLGEPPAAPPRARVHAVDSIRALRQGECGERF